MDEAPADFLAHAGRGLQHAGLRASNRRAVLTTIAARPGSSNAEVSRQTGLAPQTASAIVAELEAEGLIERGEVLRGRRGQPATPLFIRATGAFSFGIAIGWQHVEIVLSNLNSEIIARHHRSFSFPDPEQLTAELCGVIADMRSRLAPEEAERLIGIGIAQPSGLPRYVGLLGASDGVAERWADADLAATLETATGLRSLSFNDGNAGCWAQLMAQPQPRPTDLVYIHVGTFMSAGILSRSALWDGWRDATNLGDMLISSRGGEMRSGHMSASTFALGQHLDNAGIALPPGPAHDWPWTDWEPHVSVWLEDAASALAQLIVNTGAIITFDSVVLDGSLPREMVTLLTEATRRRLDELPALAFGAPEILEGSLGTVATALGAAALPLFRKYFSRDVGQLQG